MKKLVTILLVAALVLGLASTAFAASFSDVKDLGKDTQGSIYKLNGLGIISGYPDATYKPANNITRAEFAKIAIGLAGLKANADVLKNTASQYSDVAVGQWYTGWVNLASSQGYVKGFPDGTFRPNATITYGEVITVLLRVLGYNDNLPGPWPVDYIAKAGSLDITSDVTFTANAPATRADVAVMADATLDSTLVEWDADTEQFDEKTNKNDDEITLLDDNFDAAVNEDFLIKDAKYDDGTWSIKIEVTNANDDENPLDDGWYDLADDCVVSTGALPTGLGGKVADILYNDDDEVINYIDISSTVVTADGEDVDWDTAKDEFEVLDTKYDVVDYTGDNKEFVYVDAAGDSHDSPDDIGTVNEDAVYRFWINSDDEVYKVAVRTVATPSIVDSYSTSTEKLKFKDGGGTYFDGSSVDFTDEDVLVENEKTGAFGTLADIQENDVVYIDEDSYGYDYYIDLYPMTTTGSFTSAKFDGENATQMKIDGKWYDVADDNTLSRNNGDDFDENITKDALDDTYNETITYFLNKAWQVCIVKSDADGSGDDSNTVYGVVTDIVDKNNVSDKLTKIKVMKKDGSEASYTINTDEVELYYPDAVGENTNNLDIDDFVKFSVDENNEIDNLTILATWDYTDADFDAEAAGSIADPYDLYGADDDLSDYVDEDNSDYIGTITDGDTDNNRIEFKGSWYYLNDATVVFDASMDDTFGSDDDECDIATVADTADWAEAIGDASGHADAYVQTDGNKVEYIYVHESVASSGADYAATLDTYVVDGDDWVDLDVKGETKSYEVKSDADIPDEDCLYDYSIASDKFEINHEIFDPEHAATLDDDSAPADGATPSVIDYTYYVVTDVDAENNGVEINGTWFYADEDTIIYNYSDYYDSDDDPAYCESVADIDEDDYIMYLPNGDGENVADMFIIVNNIDEQD